MALQREEGSVIIALKDLVLMKDFEESQIYGGKKKIIDVLNMTERSF